MRDVAFWYEYRRRADTLVWLAMVNPPLIGLHAMTAELSRPALEFWLMGLGVTFLICFLGAAILYVATALTIRRGVETVTREKMWNDIIRRGPFMRVIAKTPEAG